MQMICVSENPEDCEQRYDISVSPMGAPMPTQTVGGETQPEQHNPVLWHRVVLTVMQGLTDYGKAGDFGSVPRMLTH